MARTAPLRAVKRDERAAVRKSMSISEAIAAGDYLAELEALHRRIGVVVNDNSTSPRDLAALIRRQVELSREIQMLRMQADNDAISAALEVEDEVFDPRSV